MRGQPLGVVQAQAAGVQAAQNAALRLIGQLAEGETPSAATSQDALAALKGGHVEAVDAEPARRELDPQERAALSGNDARMDTEQQIEEDAARAAANEQARTAPKQD